ncbi:hypothetical protein [Thiofilum flexile]|uniref:hypothetical protein n=1 Tax=Thiofilum flexile TaxID=125627 RepID=UPI00036AC140|nr:hypothetical protein [Thiofilum flexile]
MSPWDELGIAATNDKKLIKKAYAQRLKVTRPEENAAAFQALYEAYQQALSAADYSKDYQDQAEEEKAEPAETTSFEQPTVAPEITVVTSTVCPLSAISPVELESKETPTEVVLAPIVPNPKEMQDEDKIDVDSANKSHNLPTIEQQLEQEWLRTENWLEQLLATPEEVNQVANWSFLKRSPLLQDLEWRIKVSTYVFEKIASVNYKSLNNTELAANTLYIKPVVLSYLDSLLEWERSWQYLRDIFPEVYLNAVFNYLDLSTNKEENSTFASESIEAKTDASFLRRVAKFIRVLLAFYINLAMALFWVGLGMDLSPLIAFGIAVFIVYTYLTTGRFIQWIALGHTIMGLKYGAGK